MAASCPPPQWQVGQGNRATVGRRRPLEYTGRYCDVLTDSLSGERTNGREYAVYRDKRRPIYMARTIAQRGQDVAKGRAAHTDWDEWEEGDFYCLPIDSGLELFLVGLPLNSKIRRPPHMSRRAKPPNVQASSADRINYVP